MPKVNLKDVQVLAPNFKRRLSGVTSTIVQLIPMQNRLGQKVAAIGTGLPNHLPHVQFRDLWRLWQNGPLGGPRIWHARRNIEMLQGLLMRDLARMKVKLIFTSAAQRRHSRYTRLLISKMDAVVATSGRSGSFLDVPYEVVMHGVDTALFQPGFPLHADTIVSTGLAGAHLVGCFGRIRYQKGTDLFVRAMIELLPDHPEWAAIVSGRVMSEHKSFAERLKTDIAAAGLSARIIFPGEVDDIKPLYRCLSLYVAPSRNEGFGLTPLEAMASQVAVIASNAGAYKEMIVEGRTGMVVETGDYDALRDAIGTYMNDVERLRLHAGAALVHVRTTFPLEKEAASLGKIYDKLRQHLQPLSRIFTANTK